jgi:hypothetical protein
MAPMVLMAAVPAGLDAVRFLLPFDFSLTKV